MIAGMMSLSTPWHALGYINTRRETPSERSPAAALHMHMCARRGDRGGDDAIQHRRDQVFSANAARDRTGVRPATGGSRLPEARRFRRERPALLGPPANSGRTAGRWSARPRQGTGERQVGRRAPELAQGRGKGPRAPYNAWAHSSARPRRRPRAPATPSTRLDSCGPTRRIATETIPGPSRHHSSLLSLATLSLTSRLSHQTITSNSNLCAGQSRQIPSLFSYSLMQRAVVYCTLPRGIKPCSWIRPVTYSNIQYVDVVTCDVVLHSQHSFHPAH